jgi:hypothetical protein
MLVSITNFIEENSVMDINRKYQIFYIPLPLPDTTIIVVSVQLVAVECQMQ